MEQVLNIDWLAIKPILTIVVGAVLLLLIDLFNLRVPKVIPCLLICGIAWWYSIAFMGINQNSSATFLYSDTFSFLFNSLLLLGFICTVLLSEDSLPGQRVNPSMDIYVLLLLVISGAMVMVAASNLMVLFIGFELLSVSVYVLTGLARNEKTSAEGAMKYFILGAFSSAFLLYGMTLIYGATGSMELAEIAHAVNPNNSMLILGIGLLIFGFGFKVSLVPFHFWTPDVYQGAPISIAGFMAVVVKVAAFGSFLRVMYVCFASISQVWSGLIWILCVLTMCLGNLVALQQTSIKRMLAYSSIAHAGYALIGFLVFNVEGGAAATVFYLFVYSLMTIASFGVVLVVTKDSEKQYDLDSIQSLRGIGWSRPFVGFVMVVAMLSLAGMPPFAGFIGKFYLFSSAIKAGYLGLVIIAALNSVVSLYYYLQVIVVMYFSKAETDSETVLPVKLTFASLLALGIATVATICVGLFPQDWLGAARFAMEQLITVAQAL